MIIRNSILSKKYAKAFVNTFSPSIDLDFIDKLTSFNQQIKNNRKAHAYMDMLSITDEEKKKVLHKLLTSFGIDNNIDKLIDILIEHRRLNLLFSIFDQIIQKYKDRENIIDVVLKSAHPLSETELKTIEDFFAKKVGKKVSYKYLIDKSLIEGVKIVGDNYLWEYSLNQQLNNIMRIIKEKNYEF